MSSNQCDERLQISVMNVFKSVQWMSSMSSSVTCNECLKMLHEHHDLTLTCMYKKYRGMDNGIKCGNGYYMYDVEGI